jgi:hypothetical protein
VSVYQGALRRSSSKYREIGSLNDQNSNDQHDILTYDETALLVQVVEFPTTVIPDLISRVRHLRGLSLDSACREERQMKAVKAGRWLESRERGVGGVREVKSMGVRSLTDFGCSVLVVAGLDGQPLFG